MAVSIASRIMQPIHAPFCNNNRKFHKPGFNEKKVCLLGSRTSVAQVPSCAGSYQVRADFKKRGPPAPLEVFTLGQKESLLLQQQLMDLPPTDDRNTSHFLAYKAMINCLLLDVGPRLHSIYNKWDDASCGSLVRNLPLDPCLPPTPQDGCAPPAKATHVSELVLVAMAYLLGCTPFGTLHDNQGALIHQIAPQAGKAAVNSSAGSARLAWHVENCALARVRPDFVLLLCLRADHTNEAVTRFVDVYSAVRALPARAHAELRKPQFRFRFSAARDGVVEYGPWQPVLGGPDDMPELTVNYWDPQCFTLNASEALHQLEAVLDDPANQTCVKLRPGDLLILDNRRTAHSRTPFTPKFDGNDRWLQRLWAKAATWPGRSEGMTDPLVFD